MDRKEQGGRFLSNKETRETKERVKERRRRNERNNPNQCKHYKPQLVLKQIVTKKVMGGPEKEAEEGKRD